jgi:hypothetical protein
MRQRLPTQQLRAERRAAAKTAVRWHGPSTGRPKSALTPSGDRPRYAAGEGLT